MPRQTRNSRLDVLSKVFRHPPVIILFKITYTQALRAAGYRKLVLFRTPFNGGGRSVDTQDDEGGFPCVVFVAPNVRVSVLRTRHESVGRFAPVDAGDDGVVFLKGGLEFEFVSLFDVNSDFAVVGTERDSGTIAVPSMS